MKHERSKPYKGETIDAVGGSLGSEEGRSRGERLRLLGERAQAGPGEPDKGAEERHQGPEPWEGGDFQRERVCDLCERGVIAYFLLDGEGVIGEVNSRGCELLGYEKGFLRGQRFSALVAGEDRELFDRYRQEVMGTSERRICELSLARSDGSVIAVQLVSRGWGDGQGQLGAMQVAVLDITQRKKAEQALKENEERYRIVAEKTGQMVYDYDPVSGDINWVGAIREITGYSEEEFQRIDIQGWEELIHREDRERAVRRLEEAQAQGSPYDVEYRMRRKDRSYVFIEDHGVFLKDGQGRAYRMLGSMKDISERKKAESERERLIAELERKNAELEQFAYTVSHDLKSPLITITGFVGLLQRDAAARNLLKMKADMAYITEAAIKMQQLLKQLLELSRIGRVVNPPRQVSLRDLVEEVAAAMAERLAQRRIQLVIGPDLPVVYADRMRLKEVLENLLDNAVKFMGEQAEPRIEIGSRAEGGEAVCYVRDNGMGIAERYQEKIFGLFDKLDSQSEGTGVGLSLVKRIIEYHGGRIWVESEGLGRGSTFCFTLPGTILKIAESYAVTE